MRITDDEIEKEAWRLVRGGQAPGMRELVEWLEHEISRRESDAASGDMMRTTVQIHATAADRHAVARVLWRLMMARVIVPGTYSMGNSLSFSDDVQLVPRTDGATEPLPADPGFVDGLLDAGIDGIALRYVREAIRALSASACTAAMVMIGVASELIMSRLLDAHAGSVYAPEDMAERLGKRRTIKERYDEFRRSLASDATQRRAMLREAGIIDGADDFIGAMFNAIRVDRNEAGHPTGRDFDYDEAQANFLLFRSQARLCMKLVVSLEGKRRDG